LQNFVEAHAQMNLLINNGIQKTPINYVFHSTNPRPGTVTTSGRAVLNSNRFSYFDVQEPDIQLIAVMPKSLTGRQWSMGIGYLKK
jgi:hypothetical protein